MVKEPEGIIADKQRGGGVLRDRMLRTNVTDVVVGHGTIGTAQDNLEQVMVCN